MALWGYTNKPTYLSDEEKNITHMVPDVGWVRSLEFVSHDGIARRKTETLIALTDTPKGEIEFPPNLMVMEDGSALVTEDGDYFVFE